MKFHEDGRLPPQTHHVWVFGSNLSGAHGAGAARIAHNIYNRPYGEYTAHGIYKSYNLQESYAIPTKDKNIQTMDLDTIKTYVDYFIGYVIANPMKEFFITRVGCGLANYSDSDVAPMFRILRDLPNVSVAKQWKQYMGEF